MHKPEILILDEPMNGLDPIGIYEMRVYLVNLCKEGNTTVFISSHILSEIEQIAECDRDNESWQIIGRRKYYGFT
ncbi:hypothetical protein [Roseburia inulinivorans]|uniref:hypothetical protein n=1 Tax=Roseburia inulinivorans TaxID=360807 RepID=UPI0020939271|nr:hypothetical protein [Roseburia inulinivorans]